MSNIELQCLLGIQCNEFTMIAADQINTKSVFVYKDDEDKIFQLSDKLMMGVAGEEGETAQFAQFVAKNIQLYKMRNGYELDTAAAAHFTRRTLADGLRSGTAYMVNLLLGGFEPRGGQLYRIDLLGACQKVPFASHGYGGMLGFGILEDYYKPTLTEKESYDLIESAIHEVQKRLFINLPKFQVSVVDTKGVRRLPTICPVREPSEPEIKT